MADSLSTDMDSPDTSTGMLKRRDLMRLAAAAGVAGLTRAAGAAADVRPVRLETRLFNFRDDVSAETVADIVGRIRNLRNAEGIGGLMIGRNFIPDPFPARFEWVYVVQRDDPSDGQPPVGGHRFDALRAELTELSRNQVQCDLAGPTPPRFAAAQGVKVRHTVMFNFKPEATPADEARNVEAIRRMGRLPMVQSYRVERSAAWPAGPDQMQWQVIGDFASVADYWAYAKAPAHLTLRDDFTAHTSRVAFLDVEL